MVDSLMVKIQANGSKNGEFIHQSERHDGELNAYVIDYSEVQLWNADRHDD